jgi:hypothetical protein
MNTTTLSGTAKGTEALRLRGVLDTALPHELGTPEAPDRYTVTAVFTRRVSEQERHLIEHASVRQTLAEGGYPGVGLEVADRRLLITDTNLAMLENGLAGVIAGVLRHIDHQLETERLEQVRQADEWRVVEMERAARVKAEAERVRFE